MMFNVEHISVLDDPSEWCRQVHTPPRSWLPMAMLTEASQPRGAIA